MLERSWLGLCAGGARECLTPSHWGAKLAPQLTPRQSAEIYTGARAGGAAGEGGGGGRGGSLQFVQGTNPRQMSLCVIGC